MNKILTLRFQDEDSIVFKSFIPLDSMNSCDDICVNLCSKDIYLLSRDCAQYILLSFKELLIEVLKKNLFLAESISHNLGFIWNEISTENSNYVFEYQLIEGLKHWIGKKYLLLETPGDVKPSLSTWLYNDKDGNIILEITPTYYWHHVDPLPEDKDYISYEEFILDYKPLFTKQIPKEVALKWLEQIEELLRVIKTNEDH